MCRVGELKLGSVGSPKPETRSFLGLIYSTSNAVSFADCQSMHAQPLPILLIFIDVIRIMLHHCVSMSCSYYYIDLFSNDTS
jgi:hypothetical protein